VKVGCRTGPPAVLEVMDPARPADELRPLLDALAAVLVAALPPRDDDGDDPDGPVAALHRLTIDSLPVGLYVVDRDYRVVLWNRKRETGTQGLRRGDVLGRRVLDVLRRQPPEVLEAEFERIFATGEVRVDEQDVRVGSDVRTYRTTRLPMRIDGGEISHVITIGEDVTETRAIQRAMHQAEKLAAVGQLAAGVMHEINNPLATIGGCVAAIVARLGGGISPPVKEYLEMIDSELERCTGIIEGLLDFSRAGRSGPGLAPADVNAVLDRTLELVRHHQRFRRLQVVREFAPELPEILGNAERLTQAAMAILLNAADASSGQGRIVLRTRADAGSIIVEFEDDGPGIPADVLPKIFDPFFTTKGSGRGTGLGLAICYGIVADHHGRLDVQSEPGHGTVFRMTLPASAGEAA
jgi:two-component system NtrC family sensor kinase